MIRDAIDIRDHGACCDGTTDDSAAVERATNAVTGKGGVVFIPPGTKWDYKKTKINRLALVFDVSQPAFPKLWSGEPGFTPMVMGRAPNGNAAYWVLHNLESDFSKEPVTGIVGQCGDPDDPINLWQIAMGLQLIVYGWQDPAYGAPSSPGHQRARVIVDQSGVVIFNSTSYYLEGYDATACLMRDAMLVVNPSQPNGSTARVLIKANRKGGAVGVDLECADRKWRFQVDEVSGNVQFVNRRTGKVLLSLDEDGNLAVKGKIKSGK